MDEKSLYQAGRAALTGLKREFVNRGRSLTWSFLAAGAGAGACFYVMLLLARQVTSVGVAGMNFHCRKQDYRGVPQACGLKVPHLES